MSITVSKTFASEAEAISWLNGGNAAPAADKAPAAGKTDKAPAAAKADKPAAKPKSTVTQSQMQAALQEVKEKFGVPEAKAIITEAGGVKKMDDIPEDKYEAVFKAAQAKLEEDTDAGEGDDDGI